MLTLGDINSLNLSVNYHSFFNEMEKCKNSPLFLRDFAEEKRILELELKNLSLEFEESNSKEVETRTEVENFSVLYAQKSEKLEIITNSKKELELLIKNIEESKSKEELESLENAKKTLNVYKRLLKLKLLHSSEENILEMVIFNEKNAFLKYIKLNKDDDYVAEKVWTEIGQACDNTWKDLHRNTLLAADE